jgi:tetratricopeptide (TPR) repeat protein
MAVRRPPKALKVTPPSRPDKRWEIAWAALLSGVTLVVYLPALGGAFLTDDTDHVTYPAIRSLHGLWLIWSKLGTTVQYWPFAHSAFWVEHRLWGDAVVGYHLTNVALHVAAAFLLVKIMRRLRLPGAWLAGLLWALHPVCVQSVAWISEQKNTLSTVLYLASALVYLDFYESRRVPRYVMALGLFALALMSKSVTATLPAALLVVLWWRRGRLDWRPDIRPLVPWLALGVAYGLFTSWVERQFIGAVGQDFAMTLAARFLLAARVVWFYALKLLWPTDLVFFYPRWTVDPAQAWQYLPLVGLIAAAVAGAWLAARGRRGPLAAFLMFGGTLFPVLGFFNVYPFLFSYVADHFQYLASLYVVAPLASCLAMAVNRVAPPARRPAWAGVAALTTVLAVLSWNQSGLYRDNETLIGDSLARNPDSWVANCDLGIAVSETPSRRPEAIRYFETALRLNPNSLAVHYNLANALSEIPGRLMDAIGEYEAALRVDPTYAEGHFNLAMCLVKVPGRLPEAIAHLETALRLKPSFGGGVPEPDPAMVHANLGNALAQTPGRLQEGIAHMETAVRLDPDFVEGHYNLAGALLKSGRTADAIAEYQAALRVRPDYTEAHFNLGVVLSGLPGRRMDAVAEFEAVLRIAPDLAEAHYRLGQALAEIPGRLPEGISHIETAARLRPDVDEIRQLLARLRADNKRSSALQGQ